MLFQYCGLPYREQQKAPWKVYQENQSFAYYSRHIVYYIVAGPFFKQISLDTVHAHSIKRNMFYF
jgi:hypothetical protein